MTTTDATMNEVSAFGSTAWCAATLGKSVDWFRKNRNKLEGDGFPRVDPLIGLTMKADVEAWLARRRRLADHDVARMSGYHHTATHVSKENLDAF